MRCYFNLVNSHESIIDHDGIQVSDLDEAREIARAAAQEMVQSGEVRIGDWQGWRMKVADNSGAALFTLDLGQFLV